MKHLVFTLALIFTGLTPVFAQDTTKVTTEPVYFRIIKTDKTEVIAEILKEDEREIYVRTKDGRTFYIPQHMIKKVEEVKSSDFNARGKYVGEDRFATRYFITTNGLPVKKGEHYIQWNIFGPDFQFGVAENLSLGIMSSWLGTPLIGSIKWSTKLGERSQLGIGGLLGTGSWLAPDYGGALPFASLSFGDRSKNIAFSGGYGAVWTNGNTSGRAIVSVAGMIKVGPNISLVFDSFIMPPGAVQSYTYTDYVYNPQTGDYTEVQQTGTYRDPGIALLIPGIRWHQSEGKAFQFGFTGVITDGEVLPFPIPMVQWYRSI